MTTTNSPISGLIPRHAGIVLAAGASSRMGQPKALLETASGKPLADVQAELLFNSGCQRNVVVLGADAATIHPKLQTPTAINFAWKTGRISSVQTGLRMLPGFDGYFILPVDTVGIQAETLFVLRRFADVHKPLALRPIHRGEKGRVLWISATVANQVLQIVSAPDLRLDAFIDPVAKELDIGDGGIVNNVNTPEDWAKIKGS